MGFLVNSETLSGMGIPTDNKGRYSIWILTCQSVRSVSQLFHGPAPRSPLHRLSIRLRHSRSNTSTEYSSTVVSDRRSRGLPTQLSQVRSISPSDPHHLILN